MEHVEIAAGCLVRSRRYRELANHIREMAPALKLEAAERDLTILAADYARLADYVAGMNRLIDLLLSTDGEAEEGSRARQTSRRPS